jgi:uncharacterized protein (TIRG00374 family)
MSERNVAGSGRGSRYTILKTLLGFAIAILLVGLLGFVIGWEQTLRRLRTAEFEWVVLACLSTVLCLAAWTKTWQLVLGATGVSVPYRKLVVTFFAATFANYVTPMGQAGGEPFIAYILSRDTEATYEQSLASVVTADLIRLLPFFTVGGIGVGYLLVTAQLSGTVERLALILVALAVVLPLTTALSWRFRVRFRGAVLWVLRPITARTRLSIESVRDRIDRLYDSIEVIAGSRRRLFVSVVFAYAGWILFALPLYFAALSVDIPLSILLVCFAVPVSVIAGSTPLPGGLAAIEGTLVVLLSVLAGLTTADALAVTTIYRLTSYWFVVAVGGIAALWVLRRV